MFLTVYFLTMSGGISWEFQGSGFEQALVEVIDAFSGVFLILVMI